MKTKVKCPYCGHENTVNIIGEGGMTRPAIELCDCESGGCDKYFAYTLEVKTTTTAIKLGEPSTEKERLYHIVSVSKHGAINLTSKPMTHSECCAMKSKFTQYDYRTLMLQEA